MILHVYGKTNDLFTLVADDGSFEYEGYVPESSFGDGDEMFFKVDNEPGQNLNSEAV